jgi:Protein of unknown function (DUF998)
MSVATIVLIAAYVALGFTAQLVTPGYSALSMGASALAVGRRGWLMQLAFVARGLAALTLIVALIAVVPGVARSPWGLALIAVWGISCFVLAVFATDMPGGPRTTHGAIHAFAAAVAYIAVGVGELLVSLGLGRGPDWHSLARLATPLAVAVLIALVVQFAGFRAAMRSMDEGLGRYSGLLQRAFLALVLLWMLVVATGLL